MPLKSQSSIPTPSLPPLTALPYAARQLALVLGIEDTLKLSYVAENQHRHVYVPKTLKAECRLVQDVGWVIAMKLHKHFAGELVHVPMCHVSEMKPSRMAAIAELLAGGAKLATVAAALELSESGVRAILARARRHPTPGLGSSGGGSLRVENGPKPSVVTGS